jgi:hypothetical protein
VHLVMQRPGVILKIFLSNKSPLSKKMSFHSILIMCEQMKDLRV